MTTLAERIDETLRDALQDRNVDTRSLALAILAVFASVLEETREARARVIADVVENDPGFDLDVLAEHAVFRAHLEESRDARAAAVNEMRVMTEPPDDDDLDAIAIPLMRSPGHAFTVLARSDALLLDPPEA